jgi:hypothetical protein
MSFVTNNSTATTDDFAALSDGCAELTLGATAESMANGRTLLAAMFGASHRPATSP